MHTPFDNKIKSNQKGIEEQRGIVEISAVILHFHSGAFPLRKRVGPNVATLFSSTRRVLLGR